MRSMIRNIRGWHNVMLRDDAGDTHEALRLDVHHRPACAGIGTLAIAASLLAIPVAAFAQTAGSQADQSTVPNDSSEAVDRSLSRSRVPESDGGIEDIIVTAQKRQDTANSVGMSISAMTGDALIKQGVTTPADLVRVVPGFNYTRSSYGVPVFTLRGIGFYDTSLAGSPTVSVYTDEIPLPFSAMTTGAGLDPERVEVLKGPQGTLFGQNSTGGAINYIAAKPTGDFAAGVDTTYDSLNLFSLQGFVSGPISDTLGIRIAARAAQGGNWQRSYTRNDRTGESDLLIGRILLAWKPTADLSVQLNVNGWRDKSDNQAAQFGGVSAINPSRTPAIIRDYPFPPRENKFADWDPNRKFAQDDDFIQISGRVEYDLSDAITLTSLTAYSSLNRDSLSDVDGTQYPNYTVHQRGFIHSFYQELRVAGDISEQFRFVLGGNYGHDSIEDEANPSAPLGFSSSTFTAAETPGSTKIDRAAAFGSLDWKVTDTLTLQGGLRYTKTKRKYEGCTLNTGADRSITDLVASAGDNLRGYVIPIATGECATLGPAPDFLPGLFIGKLDEDGVSWRVNVNWQATPRALLYANVSRGYKEGVFPISGATFSFSLFPAVQEEVLAYEAGFKLGLANRRVQLNGAVFYYDYTNKQVRGKVSDPVLGRQNRLINIPESHVLGAELQATVIPVRGLRLNVGATYVKSEIDGTFVASDALGNAKDVGGEAFPLTPRWQVQADGEYSFPVGIGTEAFIGGTFNYQGKASSGLGELAILGVPEYSLIDARIGVRSADDSWSVTGFVRNLTDKYYWTFVNFASPDVAARYTGRPRTFGVTFSSRF